MRKKILILGGSSEGFELAERLSPIKNQQTKNDGFDIISSFAGRTSLPRKPNGPFRTGGFGGVDGLTSYIAAEKIDAVIDATHPFAETISNNASLAAAKSGIPIIHIWRPEWQKTKDDQWKIVTSTSEAAATIENFQSPTLLTIGKGELNCFIMRSDIQFFARTIEQDINSTIVWPDNFSFIYAKGPFNLIDERTIMIDKNIKLLVTKNSGGDQARAKLDAARELQIPVLMIARPKKPMGPIAATPSDALRWLETQRARQ